MLAGPASLSLWNANERLFSPLWLRFVPGIRHRVTSTLPSTFLGGPQLAATLRRRVVEWIGAWRNLRHGGKRRGRCERGEERVLSSTKRKRKRHGDGVLLSLKESETSVRRPKGLRPKETGCGNRRVSRQGGPEVTEGHRGGATSGAKKGDGEERRRGFLFFASAFCLALGGCRQARNIQSRKAHTAFRTQNMICSHRENEEERR